MSDWCILRTSGRHTLPLADSLSRGGYECWTPAQKIQLPRRKVKISVPVLPTWAFARVRSLVDLVELAADPVKPHPDFSVFQFNDRYPIIADIELRWLRLYVAKEKLPEERRILSKGTHVSVDDGAWAGMSGVIQRDNGKMAVVLFGHIRVEVQSMYVHTERRAA